MTHSKQASQFFLLLYKVGTLNTQDLFSRRLELPNK